MLAVTLVSIQMKLEYTTSKLMRSSKPNVGIAKKKENCKNLVFPFLFAIKQH